MSFRVFRDASAIQLEGKNLDLAPGSLSTLPNGPSHTSLLFGATLAAQRSLPSGTTQLKGLTVNQSQVENSSSQLQEL